MTVPIALNKPPLHVAAANRLRRMIEDGDLAPGERIPEQDLAAGFGISRTPMREALKSLASEGLVELLPNRGARVKALTLRDVEDIYPVIAALEGLAGEILCARITAAETSEFMALHHRMLAAYHRRDRAAYFAVNREIHDFLLKAAHNPALQQTLNGLSGRVRRARFQAHMTEADWARAVAEHERMAEALARRDGAALKALLSRHALTKMDTIRKALEGDASEVAEAS